ncbi:MAG: hypothetical protein IT464_10000 [Planctomycetes bacterium]|nr:hypothetical protein [Planctomycetota bacterium]
MTFAELPSAGAWPGGSFGASYASGSSNSDPRLGGSLMTATNGVSVTDIALACDGNEVLGKIDSPSAFTRWTVNMAWRMRGWARADNYVYTPDTGYQMTVDVEVDVQDTQGNWSALNANDTGVVVFVNEDQFSVYDEAIVTLSGETLFNQGTVRFEYEMSAGVFGQIDRAEMSIRCRAQPITHWGDITCEDTQSGLVLIALTTYQ